MNEIKNISCVKCCYHAVINCHICTRKKCELIGKQYYIKPGKIVGLSAEEKRINEIVRKEYNKMQRDRREKIKMRHELNQLEKDYGMSFEETMLLLS